MSMRRRELAEIRRQQKLERQGCRQPLDHIVDPHSDPAGLHQRPTCPTCAKKWDKLKAEGRI